MRLTINGERADASAKRFIEPLAWISEKGKEKLTKNAAAERI